MPAARPPGASSRTAAVSASSTSALLARGGCSTSTPTSSPRPNGSSRRARSAPVSSPRDQRGQQVAGEPALGVVGDAAAQQLERDDRHAWWSVRRSNSVSAPASLAADEPRVRHVGGRARCRSAASAPPAAPARAPRARRRARSRGARRRGCAPRSSSRSSSTVSSVSGWRCERRTSSVAARVEDHRRAADQRRQRLGDAVEAALGEHDPLQPLVRRERPLEHRVVLVDEVRGRLLGDRDERHLIGHLEQREAELRGGLAQRLGHRLVREARAEPEPGEPVPGQQLDERPLAVGVRAAASRSSAAARRPTATASGPRALRCGPSAPRSRARPRPPRGGRRDRG